VLVADARGVGLVEKNTVDSTQIPKQAKNSLRPKIIMMLTAVNKSKDSNKRITVLEAILDTVQSDGN
jgi:hypothetical protein